MRQPGPVRASVRALCDSNALFQRSHLKLHNSHWSFTLHTLSHLTELFSPHLSSSHLISSRMSSKSKFCSTIFISSEHCSTFLTSSKLFLTHLSSCARRKVFSVREKKSLTHNSRYAQKTYAQRNFCTQKFLHTNAFIQRSFYTKKLLHREAFTHKCVYTEKLLHTEKLLQTEVFTHRKCLHRVPLHMASTRSNLLRWAPLSHSKFLHIARFYT